MDEVDGNLFRAGVLNLQAAKEETHAVPSGDLIYCDLGLISCTIFGLQREKC